MKRILFFLPGILMFISCTTMMQFINRRPSENQNFEKIEASQLYAPDSTKLYEGMTMSMVRNSFGAPNSVKSGDTSFVIWEYPSSQLFFVDEILINWKEWPKLEFESSQF